MKLRKLDYCEFEDGPDVWKTTDCTFGDINLIVSRNATGKSRTLNVIKALSDLLSESSELKWGEGRYDVEFENNSETIKYVLEYHNRQVTNEQLIIDSTTYLRRELQGAGEISAEKVGQTIDFQIEMDRVAAYTKRDSIQHPFLDKLYQWGKGVTLYRFGTSLGRDRVIAKSPQEQDNDLDINLDLKETEQTIEKFVKGKRHYSPRFEEAILTDMARVGYELEAVGEAFIPDLKLTSNIPVKPFGLYVQEIDREGRTYHHHMSQGMFRAFSLIIQINYSLFASEPTCILIDDIGEGLDFSRSSALVKLLIEKAKKSTVQLIMTTNDQFIMNSVPLEYWILLERKGGEIIYHNYRNSRRMFDKFELTGLSNFDLFSSNYYLQNKN